MVIVDRQVRYAEEPTAVLLRAGGARHGELDAMTSRLWRASTGI
jgi:hypothetical protein